MTNGENEIRFEPLPLRRRVLASIGASQYCVWAASGESKEIKADTAYEAFRNCGIKNPVKIERLSNSNLHIIDKSKLVPKEAISGKEADISLHDRILVRKSPIISADELDELIRPLRKERSGTEPSPAAAAIASLVPAPEPAQEVSLESLPPSAIGVDVHGDGFDEIIPSTVAVKPPALKPHEHKEASGPAPHAQEPLPSPADLPAERELSPEEVAKLLDGK